MLATMQRVARREAARVFKQMQTKGVVSATDPLTVRLNSGADVHISHRAAGMTLTVGDFVNVRYTGVGYDLLGKAVVADIDPTLDVPEHNHDTSYAALGHAHTTALEFVERVTATGSSTTFSGSLSSTYESYLLIGKCAAGSGQGGAYARLNSDTGLVYNIQRMSFDGADTSVNVTTNRTADGVFFFTGGGLGHFRLWVHNRGDTLVGLHIEARGRATSSDAGNSMSLAYGEYESGPATSWQIVNNDSNNWSATSFADVYGIRG